MADAKVWTPNDFRNPDADAENICTQIDQRPDMKEKFLSLSPREQSLAIQIFTQLGQKSFVEMAEDAGYKVGPTNKLSAVKKQMSGKLGEFFFEYGITLFDLIELGAQLLSATKVTFVKVPNVNDDGKVIGYKIEQREIPDWKIRQKQWENMVKLGNYEPAKKWEGKIDHSHKIDVDDLEALKQEEENKRKVIDITPVVLDESANG